MVSETRNAKITGTFLGREDHGIFTAWVYLDYGGSGQGFGGRCLGGKYTHEFIDGVLEALNVESWEKLKGVPCRAEADHAHVHRIGHYLEDRWFDPREWDKKEG